MSRPSTAGRPSWSTLPQAFELFCRGVTARSAWKVAVVVGTILSLVNQGSVVAHGDATWVTWLRVLVNYLVPFTVASIGFLAACRASTEPSRRGAAPPP